MEITNATATIISSGITTASASSNSNNCIAAMKPRRGRKPKNTVETTKMRIDAIQERSANADTAETNAEIHIQTFHFGFSELITEQFAYFATLHRYDERKVFKENWEKWISEEEIAKLISEETELLRANGYAGDILDKMFKSVRYYYRKKSLVPKEPKQRKPYVVLPAAVLAKMDMHIIEIIVANTNPETKQCTISPAKAYTAYLAEHESSIPEIEKEKYKKTYKNRFFIATQNVRTWEQTLAKQESDK
jgi:hypothetical protein